MISSTYTKERLEKLQLDGDICSNLFTERESGTTGYHKES